ncbi:MAG: anaerobic ribonucleoside-triphosphate reductase activating protein [Armatimonadia bacterium]
MSSDPPSSEGPSRDPLGSHSRPAVVDLRVGGFIPLTTVEWDGRLAAVVFTQGCPWRCRYCHNTNLVPSRNKALIPWSDVRRQLLDRQGFVEAVVFSGGEPTAQAALFPALQEVKAMGYLTALHTNGAHPNLLAKLLFNEIVDYVAMDVKAPWDRYADVTQVEGSGRRAQRSANLIIRSGLPHEFRTTYHSDLLAPEDLLAIAEDLQWRGAKAWFLQKYRDEGSPDMPLKLSTSRKLPDKLLRRLAAMFERFDVRG